LLKQKERIKEQSKKVEKRCIFVIKDG